MVSTLLRGSCLECIALRILSLTLTVNSNATWPIELTVGCTHASGQNKSRGPAAYCASDPLIECGRPARGQTTGPPSRASRSISWRWRCIGVRRATCPSPPCASPRRCRSPAATAKALPSQWSPTSGHLFNSGRSFTLSSIDSCVLPTSDHISANAFLRHTFFYLRSPLLSGSRDTGPWLNRNHWPLEYRHPEPLASPII